MKKPLRILTLTAAIVMILSCGVAFADPADKTNDVTKPPRGGLNQALVEKWHETLNEEDKAKYEIYQGKIEELKALRNTFRERYQANRELRKQIYNKIEAYLEDDTIELTNEQLTMILSMNNDIRDHLKSIKTTVKSRREIVKNGREAVRERNLDNMIIYADQGIAKMKELIAKADETTTMLNDILKILE